MKKVYSDRWEVLNTAINGAYDREVHVDNQHGKYMVGWASIGRVDSERAEKFAEAIIEMTNIAEMLNRHEVKFVYTEEFDPEINTEEKYDIATKMVADMVINKKYREIEAFVLAGEIK